VSTSDSGTRSVKIGSDERTGWSSDRPRPGAADRPPRPTDISTRARILALSDRMRYSPGSLVIVVSASAADRDRFVARVFEEQGAVLGIDKIRALVAGRVPDDQLDAQSALLLEKAVGKRLDSGQSVVVPVSSLDPAEREGYVRAAHALRRPRHLILLETPKEQVSEEDALILNDLRRSLDNGEIGLEGFQTALRLGGATIEELKRVVFRPPPRDDD
jgi:predicted kinase